MQEKIQTLEHRQPTSLLNMDRLLSIPNALNVLTNLLFGWAGGVGLYRLAWFLVARICELLDTEIYNWLVLVSGHSLKHITASIGCLVFLRYLSLRRSRDQ